MMRMKRLIASAALVTTVFGTGSVALANNAPATATTSTQAAVTATAQTGTQTDAQTAAPAAAGTDTTAQAQAAAATTVDASLPEVSLTPDKLFYGLKLWIEQIKVAITRDAAEKAALLEAQAQTRLAEAKVMAEAGKADLAQKALDEAAAKLAAAKAQIEAAAKANKDMSKLAALVEADQVRFAVALDAMVEKAPDEVKAQVEPMVVDLLVQAATNADAAKQDDQPAQEAAKVAEEAQLKVEMESLQPRVVLVLNAMSKSSGRDLKDVLEMYRKHPGLGLIAKELNVHMGEVQYLAQADWKKKGKVEIKVVPVVPVSAATAQPTITTVLPKVEIEVEDDDDDKVKVKLEEKKLITIDGLSFEVKAKGEGKFKGNYQGKDRDDDYDDHKGRGRGNGKGHGKDH